MTIVIPPRPVRFYGAEVVHTVLVSALAYPRTLYGALREIRRADRCDYLVVSRAKSGRTWLRAMLSRLYQRHFQLAERQLIEYDNFHRQNPGAAKVHFSHGHYLRARLAGGAGHRMFAAKPIVFLVRNPLDVAVSEYFQSTRRASSLKRGLLNVDREVPIFRFVMESEVGLPATIEYMNAWAPIIGTLDHAFMLRYEDLRAHPVESLSALVRFLRAPFSKEEIHEAVEFASFKNLRKLEQEDYFHNDRLRARNPDDPESFKVRRGKVGGYTDYFDAGEIRVLERLVGDRLSPFYGYGETAHGFIARGQASRGSPGGPSDERWRTRRGTRTRWCQNSAEPYAASRS